jgi:hypothetical protein
VKHGRANNKEIRKLLSYVKDDIDSIDNELVRASKKHLKPNEQRIDQYVDNINLKLKCIKYDLKFKKE